jgi:hypothetical protein
MRLYNISYHEASQSVKFHHLNPPFPPNLPEIQLGNGVSEVLIEAILTVMEWEWEWEWGTTARNDSTTGI